MARTSTNLNSNKLSSRDLLIIAGAVILIVIIYLLTSRFTYGIGFPLDDSWIHQTYARNLALHGEWAFRTGIPSAGSTSPLWSALLAIGFLLRLSPHIWTYFLGAVTLFALAVICEWAVRKLVASYRPRFPWVGIFIAFEWHLAWAAMSGMETLLHGLIVTTVLVLLMTNSPRYLTLGLLTGLAVWVRPDGLTLLGPVLLTILITQPDTHSRLTAITRYLIGFGSIFLFYILFNLTIGGTPMPNTFYAKQAEYASWQTLPDPHTFGSNVFAIAGWTQPCLGHWSRRLAGHIHSTKKVGERCCTHLVRRIFNPLCFTPAYVSARTLHHARHADFLFIWLAGFC